MIIPLLLITALTFLPAADPMAEACFLSMTNVERTSRMIPALHPDDRITAIARRHSDRMAARGSIFHNPNLARELPPFEYGGENVGMGPDCKDIHEAFMASKTHRALILAREYVYLGVGVTISEGTVFATLDFFTPRVPSKPKASPTPSPSPCRCR